MSTKETYRLVVSAAKASEKERKLLSRYNMPGYLYRARPYQLDEVVRRFDVKREAAAPKSMSKYKQLDHCRSIFKADEPFVACVSSNPNDLRAKQFAGYAMWRWMRHANAGTSYWHNLTGGNGDYLRDSREAETKFASLKHLVLAGADAQCSKVKREKLRDLLERFHHIPRLVTTTGVDPVNFMNSIGYHCNLCVWIRSEEVWEL